MPGKSRGDQKWTRPTGSAHFSFPGVRICMEPRPICEGSVLQRPKDLLRALQEAMVLKGPGGLDPASQPFGKAMLAVLALGFVIGLQHALEADHIAAVSNLLARADERRGALRGAMRHGLFWGIGHSCTLLAMVGAFLAFGLAIGETAGQAIEALVGALLVFLGARLLYGILRDRVHLHIHRHRDGTRHLHLHSHREERGRHGPERHENDHRVPVKSLLIGLLHGLAGSAALVLLAANSFENPVLGFAYVVLFALGSICGMALFSAAIVLPLAWSARSLTWVNHLLQGTIAIASVAIGLHHILTIYGWPG